MIFTIGFLLAVVCGLVTRIILINDKTTNVQDIVGLVCLIAAFIGCLLMVVSGLILAWRYLP